MSQRVKAVGGVVSPAIVILTLFLITLFSCKKDTSLDTRILQPGTKCNIYSGVFQAGDFQPAQPVTVTGIYRTVGSSMIYYSVTDANGVVWVFPDNDLQVLQ
jgi:hypothetical protein